MSELPTIDPAKVSQKLLAKYSDLTYQAAQLETLAEALRDERDEATKKLAEAHEEIAQLRAAATPVENITTLQ